MKKTMSIPIIVIKTKTGYCAFSPIVDGCAATAKTVDTALKKIREALEFHFDGLKLFGKKQKISAETHLKKYIKDYGEDAIFASLKISA